MNKLINAELLLDAHKTLHGDVVKKPEMARLEQTIALQPEASEEDVIITCADCRYAAPLPHWMANICVEGTMMCRKCRGRREYGASCVQPNDYCSDAEEKE